MRCRTIRFMITVITCMAWGAAICGIWLAPLHRAIAVTACAGVSGVMIVKDGDKSFLCRAVADACACLRKYHPES